MYGYLGRTPGLLYALALPALSWLLTASLLDGGEDPGPAARALALAGTGLLTGFLLWPMLWRQAVPALPDLLRWLLLSLLGGLPLLSTMPAALWPVLALPLLAGALVLGLCLGALTLALQHCPGGNARGAHLAVTCLLLLSAATPLWLGPLADRLAQTEFTNLVVALGPLSYLAGLVEYDLFRGAWLYAHSPLGGLRHDYPDSALTTLFHCGSAALLLALTGLRARRGRAGSLAVTSFLQPLHEEPTR